MSNIEYGPIVLHDDDYTNRYAEACNTVFHKIEKLFYDREEWLNDGRMHTSDESREIAMAVFKAIHIQSDTPFEPTMEQLQQYQNYVDSHKDDNKVCMIPDCGCDGTWHK